MKGKLSRKFVQDVADTIEEHIEDHKSDSTELRVGEIGWLRNISESLDAILYVLVKEND